MRIIKLDNTSIGYIWYETPMDNFIKVWALYIDSKYINLIKENILSSFNSNILSYEAVDTVENNIILDKLGFKKQRYTLLMKMNIENYNNNERIYDIYNKIINNYYFKNHFNSSTVFSTRKLIIGKDEELRCNIQNDILVNGIDDLLL
ncbi:hypothetical protein [Clostridium sartagoforme]|uniref:hypothetical protein n=1 Tax=Clostridium sartagoforme TaxID=84031 RepID=UPI0003A635A1|nr:hypothetical protein [Clostridium sartagoforme]